jgi:cation diffusion facilitator CzcD-associated flavoprotein CzcO
MTNNGSPKRFDVAVIGAGQAGLAVGGGSKPNVPGV